MSWPLLLSIAGIWLSGFLAGAALMAVTETHDEADS